MYDDYDKTDFCVFKTAKYYLWTICSDTHIVSRNIKRLVVMLEKIDNDRRRSFLVLPIFNAYFLCVNKNENGMLLAGSL